MGLTAQAKADIEQITSNSAEWGIPMVFTRPDNSMSVPLTGLHTKHHLGINPENGLRVNVKNASVTVSEKFFINAGYVVRDAKGEVAMRDHKVQVKDSTGVTCLYVVREWFPDEAVGLIVFILGDLE